MRVGGIRTFQPRCTILPEKKIIHGGKRPKQNAHSESQSMWETELGVEGSGNSYRNEEREQMHSSHRNSNNIVQLNK